MLAKSKRAEYGAWLSRYHGYWLIALWVVMQAGCWHYYQGPRLIGDGKTYLACAQQLVETGSFGPGPVLRYAGYVAFISLFLRGGVLAVGLAQVALSGGAALAFYHTSRRLSQQYWPVAALATAVWLSWISIQAFNAFILTESVFTSCLVLGLWALVRLRSGRSALLLVALLLYTAIVRPNGFTVLAAAALAGINGLWHRGWRVSAAAGLALWLIFAVVWLNSVVEPFYLLDKYAAGTVIFGYEPAALRPPATLVLPPPGSWPIMRLGWFVAHNFGYFCQLCTAKAIYFLGYPRPWYSPLHWAWALGVLPVLYGLATRGATCQWVAAPVRVYLVAAILLQLGSIMLTTEEWDNRFSAPFIAYWVQLAALGVQPWLQRWLPLG